MSLFKVLIALVFIILAVIFIIYDLSINNIFPTMSCNCSQEFEISSLNLSDYDVGNLIKFDHPVVYEKKKLAVIVPFRDCFEELTVFVPYISRFLNEQQIPHHIFVIQQTNRLRFNKPTLQNVGFLYTKEKFDYIVLHDVDLLPLNKKLSYEDPQDCVYHVSPLYLFPEYHEVSIDFFLFFISKFQPFF